MLNQKSGKVNPTESIRGLATEAANKAVYNLQPSDRALYTGDNLCNGVYSISGLRDQIIEEYYNLHSDSKPTQTLFDQMAFDCVL